MLTSCSKYSLIKRIQSLLLVFLLLLGCGLVSAADFTETAIFNPRFKTLKVSNADDFMTLPLIRIGSHDRVVINFDEISEQNSYLEYRLIHCNADWRPSRLLESEYLSGFNALKIEDYAFSTATFVHYVNYRIELPNEDCELLRSGNYLLQVYDPDEPDEVILQARFQVSENAAPITGLVTSRTDIGHYSQFQQLELSASIDDLGNVNPHLDFELHINQNVGGHTIRRVIKGPSRVASSSIYYEHTNPLIFPAGNEYRRFESISNNFAGMNVDSLKYMGSNYHVWLKPDYIRANRAYSLDRTQHGRFIVREYNATDSDIGADYITVHFSLDGGSLPKDATVAIEGEFSEGAPNHIFPMSYNIESKRYEAEIPLKQGAYNYRYLLLRGRESIEKSIEWIEGNFYETENEYNVQLWLRLPGARADRLVGSYCIYS